MWRGKPSIGTHSLQYLSTGSASYVSGVAFFLFISRFDIPEPKTLSAWNLDLILVVSLKI